MILFVAFLSVFSLDIELYNVELALALSYHAQPLLQSVLQYVLGYLGIINYFHIIHSFDIGKSIFITENTLIQCFLFLCEINISECIINIV